MIQAWFLPDTVVVRARWWQVGTTASSATGALISGRWLAIDLAERRY
ncbi:MAG: hypothetical protein J2P27_02025 [Actinobacteria bacterium]|nr:hypothetical protein [Actinomycetota bacterium]